MQALLREVGKTLQAIAGQNLNQEIIPSFGAAYALLFNTSAKLV